MAEKTKNKPGKSRVRKKSGPEPEDIAVLRGKAEKKLREQTDRIDELSEKDVRQLAHELGTHQIELEMQNEELRRVQNELEASRSKYSDLYDFSPVGYFAFDKNGLILEVNLTGANLLGVSRSNLLNRPFPSFIDKDDRRIFRIHCDEVLKNHTLQTCEIRLRKKDGAVFHAHLQSISVKDSDGNALFCRTALSDISERKKIEEALRESEERFRIALKDSPIVVYTCDRDLRINWIYNLQLPVTDPSLVIGKRDDEILPAESVREIVAIKQRVLVNGKGERNEVRVVQDGQMFYYDFKTEPLLDDKGQIVGLRCTAVDISERKQAEDALRKGLERYSTFIDVTGQLGWATTADGEVIEDLPSWRAFTGQTFEELKGWGWTKAVHPEDVDNAVRVWTSSLAERSSYETEYRIRKYDGSYRNFMARGIPLFENDGSIREWIGTCIDITEIREATEALMLAKEDLEVRVQERTAELVKSWRELEKERDHIKITNILLELFVQKLSRGEYLDAALKVIQQWCGCRCAGIRMLDEKGNLPYDSCSGFSEEFLALEQMLSVHNDQCACIRVAVQKPEMQDLSAMTPFGSFYSNDTLDFIGSMSEEEKSRFRGVCIRSRFKSVAVIPVRYHEKVLGVIHLADERRGLVPLESVIFIESVTPIIGEAVFRFRVEDNLRQNYQLLENIFSNIHLQIAYMDRDFNYIRVNRLYAEAHGIDQEEAVGKNYFDMHPAIEEKDVFAKVAATGEPCHGYADPFVSRDHPGAATYWDWSIQPVKDEAGIVTGLVLSCLDVTEKITLQADAVRAAHLASLGEMAAGVAHEINNPINGIINYAQILLDGSRAESRQHRFSGMIIEEGMRIANIVRSLLSFARDRKEGKGPAFVDNILSSALSLSEAQLKKDGINIWLEVPEGLPAVFAQPQQILQVFLNVINNARHALNAKYPGKHQDKVLSISAREIGEAGSRRIRIIFRDQGCGIPSDIIDKVMNPFFTTKPPGIGTGLGLSISHGIISDHGGTLGISSREGEYTTVEISLPVFRGVE